MHLQHMSIYIANFAGKEQIVDRSADFLPVIKFGGYLKLCVGVWMWVC